MLCRACKSPIEEGQPVHVTSRDDFMHLQCHKALEKKAYDRILEFMEDVLGEEYSRWKIKSQLAGFVKDGMDYEGIYNALLWWYRVQGGDPSSAKGGIGIVPSIYRQANLYWKKQGERQKFYSETEDWDRYLAPTEPDKVVRVKNPVRPENPATKKFHLD